VIQLTVKSIASWCKRGDYQNCSVLCCVLKLCTVVSTLRWAVLTVLWLGFCLTGLTSLLLCHTAYVLYYCNMLGWTWWDWSLILRTIHHCFDTVGWVIWPVKPIPDMIFNVFGAKLNLTQPWTSQMSTLLLLTLQWELLTVCVFDWQWVWRHSWWNSAINVWHSALYWQQISQT